MKKKSEEIKQEQVETEKQEEQNEQIAKLTGEASLFKDIAARTLADFDNYKKRNQESIRLAKEDGIAEVIISIMPVLDSLEKALSIVTDKQVAEGLNLVQKQVEAVLKRFEILEIPALDEDFNPNFHNAVAREENLEKSGKVLEVWQKGYMMKGKVIRYAMVKVAE
jgi:molecular chaperone GrpE